jgi:hypothetical protein
MEKFWGLKKLEEARESNLSPKSVDCDGFFESEVIGEAKREGLNSDFKAKERTKRALKGSDYQTLCQNLAERSYSTITRNKFLDLLAAIWGGLHPPPAERNDVTRERPAATDHMPG